MISRDALEIIEDKIKQIIEPLGFDLVEFKTRRANNDMILRLLIDRQEGGITLGECAQLNSRIGKFIEENNIIQQRYSLEVFSPGLDRDLVDPKDFRRILNKKVRIFLKEEQGRNGELTGELVRIDGQGVYIINDQGNEAYVSFNKINKARQVIL